MSCENTGSSYVALHVLVEASENKILFNTMYKVNVKRERSVCKTVQSGFSMIKNEVHAPNRLLEAGQTMLGTEVPYTRKWCPAENVVMPVEDCALVDASSLDVSRRGCNGTLHEGLIEVNCENMQFKTRIPGVHLLCSISAPTGIPTIKQTPKQEADVHEHGAIKLRVAAWVLPNTNAQKAVKMHHFLRMDQVMRPFDSLLVKSFGRAIQSNFQLPMSMTYRDVRKWSKADHIAAATNVLGPVSGLRTVKRQSHNFTIWQTSARVGESPCEFCSVVV